VIISNDVTRALVASGQRLAFEGFFAGNFCSIFVIDIFLAVGASGLCVGANE
jgi:hypothetical protein